MEQNTEKYDFLDVLGVTNLWNKVKSSFVRNKSTTANKTSINDGIVIVNGKNELDIMSDNMYFLSNGIIRFQGMSNEPGVQLTQNNEGYFNIDIKNSNISIDKNSSIKGIKLTSNDLYYTYIRENSWLKDIEQYLVIMNNFDGDILPTIYIKATAINRSINFPLALYTTVNSQIVKLCNIFPYDLDDEKNYIYRGVFSFHDRSDEIGEIYIDKDYEITANDKSVINYFNNKFRKYIELNTDNLQPSYEENSISLGIVNDGFDIENPDYQDVSITAATATQAGVMSSQNYNVLKEYENWVLNTEEYITKSTNSNSNSLYITFHAPDGNYNYNIPTATFSSAGVITSSQHKILRDIEEPQLKTNINIVHPFIENTKAIDITVDLVATMGTNNIWCLTCQLTDQENQDLVANYNGNVISSKRFIYNSRGINMYNWFITVPTSAIKNSVIIDYM